VTKGPSVTAGHGRDQGAALSGAAARAVARLRGAYALNVFLPGSAFARRLRNLGRTVRGVRRPDQHATRLPQAHWPELLARKAIYLIETGKRDGNVNLAELAILAQAAAATKPGTVIVEIGTFDGRTTMNLAVNASAQVPVITLDLPSDHIVLHQLAPGERQYVDKPTPGERIRSSAWPWSAYARRITQLHGDSATFDWSEHDGKAGLVFVDGSHAYEYVRKDSETALRLLAAGGMVMWHDYGAWDGVTRALEELEASRTLGLRHVRGTSLVFWRADLVDADRAQPAPQSADAARRDAEQRPLTVPP
jgi:predicted O-methyltransferase YrrM